MNLKNIHGLVLILRIDQWYKNLFIFLALFFSLNLLNPLLFGKTFIGFIILILISSANYVLNDLFDENRDKHCPEKQNRPLVSKLIKRKTAFALFLVLLSLSLIFSLLINIYFFLCCLGLFVLTSLYTFYFKNLPFFDFTLISLNFVLRTLAGGFIIGFPLGVGIIGGVFAISCFLILCKRYGEKIIFGKKGAEYRPVLKYYSEDLLISLIRFFLFFLTGIFIVSSLIYYKYRLFWTIPIFIFILLRYYYLVRNSKIIVTPNSVLNDKYLLTSEIIFLISSALLMGYK